MSENNKQALSQEYFSANIVFIEELYQKFLQDSSSIDESWIGFFEENEQEIQAILADYQGPYWAKRDVKVIGGAKYDISNYSKDTGDASTGKEVKAVTTSKTDLNLRVANLIIAYQRYGHLASNLDPLGLVKPKYVTEIDPKNCGINDEDLNKEVELSGILGLSKVKISQVIDRLNRLYTSTVGCEFEYIKDQSQKSWLGKVTSDELLKETNASEKKKILSEIIRTEKFEQFLHKRFPGAKRFSVEGGDTSINAVEKIIDSSAKNGVKKIVIAMAHRGRLNTLTGVMGKPYSQMIAEFKGIPGIPESVTKSGDVKYHMGYASSREIAGNKIDLSLAFNPSHLEAANPVVAGRVRASQDKMKDETRTKALGVLIHGDAAFAGQGSVAENLAMNGLEGYDTGGMIHIIINNQVGFTANPADSRSTTYSSDLAKMIDAPIFHVNGDDAESVVKIAGIASDFRQKFKKDIVIDIVCYRRYGHNEGDEPLYTQPIMYQKIKQHPTIEKIYSAQLLADKTIDAAEHEKMVKDFEKKLSTEFDKAEEYEAKEADWLKKDWAGIKDGDKTTPKTAVKKEKLLELVQKFTKAPEGFNLNPKIAKQLDAKKKSIEEGKAIDWSGGEALAFASLLDEEYPIRLTGQDSGRGTFSHRHSILHDAKTGSRHNIFNSVSDEVNFEVHDSVLSEYAVLGFEHGYSLSSPNSLTIWEAQFGDFANGAQVIFDQFISSSEVKWLRKSGLVCLLPHGYEGQGPEHSSAHLERFLQSCADDNQRICNITTPANFFHALRRQLHSGDRKPLMVMSPKSLLRHKAAVSAIEEFSDYNFREILTDESKLVVTDKVKKVIFCSGKVYYDLADARATAKKDDIAIVRLEQLYPFADKQVSAELKKYKNAEVIWCQEEPRNMGAWKFVEELIEGAAISAGHKNPRPKYVGRVACASPATGYASYHAKEQEELINEALK